MHPVARSIYNEWTSGQRKRGRSAVPGIVESDYFSETGVFVSPIYERLINGLSLEWGFMPGSVERCTTTTMSVSERVKGKSKRAAMSAAAYAACCLMSRCKRVSESGGECYWAERPTVVLEEEDGVLFAWAAAVVITKKTEPHDGVSEERF
jgi:hypothetical protein